MESYYTLLLATVALILFAYRYLKKKYSYFDDKDFPTLKPTFIFGNMGDAFLLKKPMALNFYDLYNKTEPYGYAGLYIFCRPFVLFRDPELIKNVLIKDFAHFSNRGQSYRPNDIDPLHQNLLRMKGDEWKKLRLKLTPIFTTGKLKMMFPLVQEIAGKLTELLNDMKGEDFDIKDLSFRYTTDVIGSCAFGLEANALNDSNSKFREMGERILKFRYQVLIRIFFTNLPESVARFFKLKVISEEVELFFTKIVENTVKYREENNITRYDFLDLLIALKNQSDKYSDLINEQTAVEEFLSTVGHSGGISTDIDMTMELVVAQSFIFFAAGSHTSSGVLVFLLLELALNKLIQNKVREEILRILGNNDKQLTYENLREMTYMDMVIAETLRKHPPVAALSRRCTKPYAIPNSAAVIPGKMQTFISIYGLHMDPKYYEKPKEFYPEHFTEEAKRRRPACTYMPFGDGPHGCIGERFAKMGIKIALVNLLKDFSFDVSPKMKFPIEYDHELVIASLTPKNEVWLQCQKI